MNIYKLYTILLVIFLSSGCVATSKLLEHSETVTTTWNTGKIGEFIDGVITNDNTAILCFSGIGSDISDSPFSIELPVKRYLDAIDLGENEYKRSSHSFYRKSTHTWYIRTKRIGVVCSQLPGGRKIIKLHGKSKYNTDEWNTLDSQHNYDPLYISAEKTMDKSYFRPYLHLSKKNKTHKQNLLLIPIISKTKEGCTVCYAGVPFAVVIDIAIFPFVAMYYIFTGQAIQMDL